MSFTSVLKKIGIVLLDGSEIATEVMGFPFVSQLLGGIKIGTSGATAGSVATTITGDMNSFAAIISMAETMFPAVGDAKTGPAKLAAATPLVQQAILAWAQSNLPGHNKVKDPVLLEKAAGEITGGWADALNSFGA